MFVLFIIRAGEMVSKMTNPSLTITASNKNRLKLDNPASQWFIKSIQWQDFQDFELLIADGGSDNYEELKTYFAEHKGPIKMRIVQHPIGDVFHRALLNNVGIRNALGTYVMTTDVDMLLWKGFTNTLMSNLAPNRIVESRTMYLKDYITKEIYEGKCDPYNDIKCLKRGRLKKITSAGGCQCMHKDTWAKVRGFDESYYGWGSEDWDLYTRAKINGINVVWIGGSVEAIELFHQHHPRPTMKQDLEHQEENKKRLAKISRQAVNPNGWGGIKD